MTATDPDDPNQEVRRPRTRRSTATGNSGGTVVPRRRRSALQRADEPVVARVRIGRHAGVLGLHHRPRERPEPVLHGRPVPAPDQPGRPSAAGAIAVRRGESDPVDPPDPQPAGLGRRTTTSTAIHRYDGIPVTANAATNTFADAEDVREHRRRAPQLDRRHLPAPLKAGTDYFVVTGDGDVLPGREDRRTAIRSTSPTQAPGRSSAERIRIIGDDPVERAGRLRARRPLTKVPSIFASKCEQLRDPGVRLGHRERLHEVDRQP